MSSDVAYAVVFVAATAVSLAVGVAAWRRRPAPGSLGLALLSLAHAMWSGTLALQWILTDHTPSLAWLAVRNVGLFLSPIAILILVLSYTGRDAWLTARTLVAVSVVPIGCWLVMVTEPWHGLYLGGIEPAMKFSSTTPVALFQVAYSYGLMLFAVGLLVIHLLRRPPHRAQAAVLLLALLLPIVHFALQFAGVDLLPRVNSVPFSFTVSGALMLFALTRLGLFRLVPIARDQVIEQLPIGVVVYDADRRIIDANPAAMRMTGASGVIMGKTSDEAFPRQLETILRIREGLLTADTATALAEFAPGLWVEATASVLHDRSGERIAILVMLRDVTAQRAAERMQRDFVANVAHELQTPLTGLSLLARTIPRAMREDPSAVDGFVERLGSEVDRLVHLTGELMTLSRAETLPADESIEPADVGEVVAAKIEDIRGVARAKGLSLEAHVPGGLRVACDEFDLAVVVGNLIQNAVRYTGAGGHVVLSAERAAGSDGAPWVEIRVTDDGIGIPAEDQQRVFERFYRVDRARSRSTGGTGLGLAIVKVIVESHGGSVALVSTPGEGSTFTVRLHAA
ncbi:MAG: histidine kinase N-terminal 7TM domain-containing protein [Coriobacteriia bacterium]|nr:histidine kinase N-terminal 7TM domain-containing protein [Coriobacteriia bacterium]